MTKSGRKRKKADKAKVQLKKGKKSLSLPKGLNVTDSRVTTKKITLVTQLTGPSQDDGPLTRKKIGMKDLLSKMSSLSSSIRVDGLEGLMELIKGEESSSILEEHLSLLMNKIAPMVTDRERKIRKLANTIFSTILKQVDVIRMEPLFPMLSAHLCCGLSHIDSYIQRDSLKHLDEILNSLPGLVFKNFHLILPNCLNQISMHRNSSSGIMGNDKARTLTTNVDDKISSLQWRKEVLERVQKLFEIFIKKEEEASLQNHKIQNVQKSYEDGPYLGMYEDFDAVNECLSMDEIQSIFSTRTFSSQKDAKSSLDQNYARSLVPLLLDTWSEALLSSGSGPKSSKFNQAGPVQVQIRGDVAPILDSVVKNIRLLLQHFKKNLVEMDQISQVNSFEQEFKPRIMKQMMDHFPYDLLQKNAKSKSDKKSNLVECDSNDGNVINQINLGLILLYLDFTSGDVDEQFGLKIINYLKDLYRLIPTQQTISQVSEVLLHLFEKQLLSKTLNSANFFIDHLSANHLNNSKLVELFSNLAVRNDLEVGAVNRWIEMLPQVLLTGNGCAQHREVIKTLLKQRNTILLQALPQNFDYFQLVK